MCILRNTDTEPFRILHVSQIPFSAFPQVGWERLFSLIVTHHVSGVDVYSLLIISGRLSTYKQNIMTKVLKVVFHSTSRQQP